MKNNKTLQAVIFDVDGTLADTEQDGHRLAFNAAFKQFNLSWNWDIKLYGELLQVTGGKERIAYYMEKYAPRERNQTDLDSWIAALHKTKTKYFEELLAQGRIPLRPGVARLINELRDAKIRLAIATTTTPENVTALLKATLGKDAIAWFDVIGAGDIVPQKKPAPDIYHWVLNQLDLAPAQCVAIEDSENGLRSALAANIPTLITINNYTNQQNFKGASIILSDLGEPTRFFTTPTEDKSNNSGWVNIEMLQNLINQ